MPLDGTSPRARRLLTDHGERLARAREAVLVLDDLEQLLEDGECWLQCEEHDLNGRYCMTGALDKLSPGWKNKPGSAGMYLFQAMPEGWRTRWFQ